MARFLPAWNTYQEQASSRTAEGAAIEPDLSVKTSAAVCFLGLATSRLAISLSLTMPLGTIILSDIFPAQQQYPKRPVGAKVRQ